MKHATTKPHVLESIALLKGLPTPVLREIEKKCVWRDYGEDEQIFDRDNDSRDIYFVVSGRVRIVNYSMSGREVSFDDISTGGTFGELAAIDAKPRSASVVAREPTTVAALESGALLELAVKHPQVAIALMKRLARVVRTATERIMDLSTHGAHNRVYAELLRLARGDDDSTAAKANATITPMPTHSEIASRVSTTRETVARVLSELQHSGLVRREQDGFVVTDLERLRAMVEEFRGE
ncbi:MAG: Crp/Fnr family transcriptional regulator [Alphaproteobacteria bacterium]